MSLQTILIIGGILMLIAIIINVAAFVLEKKYKKKMTSMSRKE